jgi:hypothetical protein
VTKRKQRYGKLLLQKDLFTRGKDAIVCLPSLMNE